MRSRSPSLGSSEDDIGAIGGTLIAASAFRTDLPLADREREISKAAV